MFIDSACLIRKSALYFWFSSHILRCFNLVIVYSFILERENPMNTTLTVRGMTCGHCERAVTAAIAQLDAAAQVHIQRSGDVASVSVQSASLSPEQISAAIVGEGYAVE